MAQRCCLSRVSTSGTSKVALENLFIAARRECVPILDHLS